jgi:hypothetical protein
MATLLWDAVQASDLRGYRIYYGFAPDALVNKVDVGNVVTYMLGPFQLGLTLYAVITAIDTSGNESGPSNEASKVIS